MILAATAFIAAADHYTKHMDKRPERTSVLSGNAHVVEMMEGSPVRFKRAGRMDREIFTSLVREMRDRGKLHDTRKGVTVER